MAKFNYRLQSTLDLKGKLEEQKKIEFGQAIARLEAEKQKKIDLENQKSDNINLFRESIAQGIRPDDLKQYNTYIDVLKIRIKGQDRAIQLAEKAVEKKRLELVEAVQERKKLEKLRERAYEEYVIEEKIAEQKIVDEVVSYRYN